MLFATTSSLVPYRVRLEPTWINGSYTHVHAPFLQISICRLLAGGCLEPQGDISKTTKTYLCPLCRNDGFRRQQLVKIDAVVVVAQPKEIATKRTAACACNSALNKHRRSSQIMNSLMHSLMTKSSVAQFFSYHLASCLSCCYGAMSDSSISNEHLHKL